METTSTGFDYNIGFNLSTIHNEMLKADPNQVLYGSAWKGDGHFVTQTLKGYPVASFWLYQTDGIFQTDAEAAAYVNSAANVSSRVPKPVISASRM